MSKINNLLDKIRESQAYQELRSKYDSLDSEKKLYLNFGMLGTVVIGIALSLLLSISKLNGIKNEINERELLIGYLQQSADTIKQLKSIQNTATNNIAVTMPLPQVIDSVLLNSGIDKSKLEVGPEKVASEDKDTQEFVTEVKFNRFNLRSLLKFLFSVSEQGAFKTVHVTNINIETKDDPKGYIEGSVSFSSHRPKQ